MKMASKITHTEIWPASVQKIYQVITDYTSYPQFLLGVDAMEILKSDAQGAEVKCTINVVKKVSYIIKVRHEMPRKVEWTLLSSDTFKYNQGQWLLRDLGDGQTEVNYQMEVAARGFFLKGVVRELTKKNLPIMMQSFRERVGEV